MNQTKPPAGTGHTVRTACSGCGAANPQHVLSLGSTPLADTYPGSPDDAEVYYPLRLQYCARCGLVQLADVVPDALLYGPDYGFSSGTSPAKRAAHAAYAAHLLERYKPQATKLTVEIACNDGDLLARFAAAGCRAVGVDPAPRQAEQARERDPNMRVHAAPFTLKYADVLLSEYGPAGLIIASNVLAHVSDPNDFMAGVARLLAPTGAAVIQVQYLGDLIAGNEWDHVYHEHRAYFSLRPLGLLAMRHGMSVRAIDRVPDQGGSLRVTLRHGVGYGDPGSVPFRLFADSEGWLQREDTYTALQGRVDYCQAQIIEHVDTLREQGQTIAGYAASAKSCTLLNYCDLGSNMITHVVDTTPAKIGRYTPGTKIPIVGPGERDHPDVYLHLAHNYLGWTLRNNPDLFGGKWLVPIPMPVVL